MLHLFNVFCENKDSDNCAQLLEEECNKMFGIRSLYDKHDCNVVSINSLNIHDANDLQSHKLGDAWAYISNRSNETRKTPEKRSNSNTKQANGLN